MDGLWLTFGIFLIEYPKSLYPKKSIWYRNLSRPDFIHDFPLPYTFIQKSIWNFLKRYDENFSKNPYPYFWISYPKFESREKSSIKWLKDNIIYIYEGKVVTSIKYFINTFPLSFQIWRISYEFSKQNQTNNIFTNYSLLTSSRFQHNNGSRHQNDWKSYIF